LKTIFENPTAITEVRHNECIITLDPNDGWLEYNVKIDYDQNVEVENSGTVNLTYKKYENGMVHMSDVIGIWKTSASKYKLIESEVQEEYEHQIEITTAAEPLTFTISLKDMKRGYEELIKFFKEYKAKK
jgi:hypothetical protein